MTGALFTYKDLSLEYFTLGKGPKTILYFHGYGKNAQELLDYKLDLLDEYTVYSFNFFHHGQSVYPAQRIDANTLQPGELADMLTAFLCEKQITRTGLMGYSMGGKICLTFLEHYPQQVDFMVLNAPDGIKRNFWYRFTCRTKAGNALYRHFIQKPGILFGLIKTLRATGLLSPKLARFALIQLETPEKREHVYRVWMTLRHIEPGMRLCLQLLEKYNIPLCLNYGRYDRIIKPRSGQKLHRRLAPLSVFNLVEKGHNMACEDTGHYIAQFLPALKSHDNQPKEPAGMPIKF